jgi:hypothetical protein
MDGRSNWRTQPRYLRPGLAVSADAGCVRKEVDGTTAYLSLWFPSDLNVLGRIQEP